MAELQVATVRAQVALMLATDFKEMKEFSPDPRHAKDLTTMFDQLNSWGVALRAVRKGSEAS